MTIWEFANAHPFWFTVNVAFFSTAMSIGIGTALTIIGASKKQEHHHYNGDLHVPYEEEK